MHIKRYATFVGTLLLLFGGVLSSVEVLGADFPSRPIRLLVAFAPGGATDILARIIANGLTDRLGKSVVVDNRPGAGGLVGTEIASKAVPDGYTLILISSTFSVNPVLHKKLPFDPIKDFEPVILAASVPLLVVINPSLSLNSVRELVAYAKEHPDRLSYASSGSGSITNLAGELFNKITGVRTVHVPYKGTGQVFVDLLSGQVQLTFGSLASALPFVQAKRLKALAITSAERSNLLPEVPTVREAGVPGYEVESWQGILGPAGTPTAVLDMLHRETTRSLRTPEASQKVAAQGFELRNFAREQFRQIIKDDIEKWRSLYHE